MIDIYDSETLVKVYRMLAKKCEAIDKYINNHALYFGPTTAEYGALDVCNDIIELMARKNQLINIKIIVDGAVKNLDFDDKKILFIKMHYDLSMQELCGILDLKQRTAFRKIEHAFASLALNLNRSKYHEKLEKLLIEQSWISRIKQEVKERRMAYIPHTVNSL